MLGGVTRHMLPHLPGFPHLHVNKLVLNGQAKASLLFLLNKGDDH